MLRMTVERVEVDQDEKDLKMYDCVDCDGTGKQTKKEGTQVWRFPLPCLKCSGHGVNTDVLLEQCNFLLGAQRFTTGDHYRRVIRALLKIVELPQNSSR